MQAYAHLGFCEKYFDGLINGKLLSALRGVVTWYDQALRVHKDYIAAYNKEYELGHIGNGKEWDQNTYTGGYRFELYPKSHPVLKSENFIIVQAKVRRIWQVFHYWQTLDSADLIYEEVTKDR